jgi:hypothetical protein
MHEACSLSFTIKRNRVQPFFCVSFSPFAVEYIISVVSLIHPPAGTRPRLDSIFIGYSVFFGWFHPKKEAQCSQGGTSAHLDAHPDICPFIHTSCSILFSEVCKKVSRWLRTPCRAIHNIYEVMVQQTRRWLLWQPFPGQHISQEVCQTAFYLNNRHV